MKQKLKPFEFAWLSAFCGISGGLVALGFAFCLWLVADLPWLAGGAACYGVALLWLGWNVGETARRESATYVSDEEENS